MIAPERAYSHVYLVVADPACTVSRVASNSRSIKFGRRIAFNRRGREASNGTRDDQVNVGERPQSFRTETTARKTKRTTSNHFTRKAAKQTNKFTLAACPSLKKDALELAAHRFSADVIYVSSLRHAPAREQEKSQS